MKRISVLLSIAAFLAISAPLTAQSNGGKYGRARSNSGVYDRNGDGVIDSRDQVNSGCSWWEINCSNTRTNGRIDTNRSGGDTGWYRIGNDRSGNVIYERDTYDRKGRETIELARQDRNGRMKVIDKRKVNQNNGRVFDRRGRRGDRDEDDRDDNDRDR